MGDKPWRKGLRLQITQVGDQPANLIVNPRFKTSKFPGWSIDGKASIGRLTSPPSGTSFPGGIDACVHISTTGGDGTYRAAMFLDFAPDGNGSLIAVKDTERYAFSAYVYKPDTSVPDLYVYWYDGEGNAVGSASHVDISQTTFPGVTSNFTWCSAVFAAPAGATMCQPAFHVESDKDLYVAGVRFSAQHVPHAAYVDGDSLGYCWEGEAHNSYALPLFTRAWDATREAQDIDFTTKMPGGFSKLSFVVSRSVTRKYDDLKRDNQVSLTQDGHVLFEGFIQDVAPEIGDAARIRVTCSGAMDRLRHDTSFRRVYKDTALRHWHNHQNTDHAGLLYDDKKERLHLRIPKNITVASGSQRRLYYKLFDGIPMGDRIRRFTATATYDLGTGGNWYAELIGRDDIDDGSNDRVLWQQNTGTATRAAIDVDLAISGKSCRVILLKLRWAGNEATVTDDRYVILENVAVYATLLDTVRVDTVIADIAAGMAKTVNAPAQASFDIDHACFYKHTTRAHAIQELAHYVEGEYDYAFWEDLTFTADNRLDGSSIPSAKTIVVQADQPGVVWGVHQNFSHSYDGVVVRYRKPDKGADIDLAELTRPAGGATRLKLLDRSRGHHRMSPKTASRIARRFLKRRSAGTESGSVTLTGDLLTANGVTMPATQIRAGMWIDNISMPGHRPLFITKSRVNLDTGEVKLRINDGDRRHMKHQIKWLAAERDHHGSPISASPKQLPLRD
jgi:hypothetical protein